MLLSEPLASLMTFFRTSLIKYFNKGQRMSDSFYHITESRELDLKKKGPKHSSCRSAMFWNFYVGIHMYSASTYDVMKSCLTRA